MNIILRIRRYYSDLVYDMMEFMEQKAALGLALALAGIGCITLHHVRINTDC